MRSAVLAAVLVLGLGLSAHGQALIIDHRCTDIIHVPQAAIEEAKASLHIAYGHTSHGGQITNGMIGLVDFVNAGGKGLSYPADFFAWNNGGYNGALDMEEGDGYGDGWLDHDCGYYPEWVSETRVYLDDASHADVNVLMWSWCGQMSYRTAQELIDTYLDPMAQLEADYPQVRFVYMTGHLDGTGESGNLHQRNEEVRQYCRDNGKILYDFADIESYDPDGTVNYMALMADDGCNYDSDGDGSVDANWAQNWQDAHTEGVDWYEVYAAHSESVNGNMKAYAAWWLFAALAGWNQQSVADSEGQLAQFVLYPNYPNPFNPSYHDYTSIEFDISTPGPLRLSVYDVTGRWVADIPTNTSNTAGFGGHHDARWDGCDHDGNPVPSGVYLLRLEMGGRCKTQKVVLSR